MTLWTASELTRPLTPPSAADETPASDITSWKSVWGRSSTFEV
jgi:hypothetical protein